MQHPDYNPDTVDNDVALLRISTSEDDDLFGDSIFGLGYNKKKGGQRKKGKKSHSIASFSSACLPEQDEELPTNAHCTIVGWGKEKNSHVYGTDVLHEAEVRSHVLLNHYFTCAIRPLFHMWNKTIISHVE